MKPMVFVFSNASHYGGAERSLEIVLPVLAQSYRMIIFAENERHYHALCELETPDVRVVRLPGGNSPAAWLATILRVNRLVRSEKPSLFLANTNKAGLLAVFAQLGRRNIPAVIFVRDFLWQYRRFIFRALKRHAIVVPTEAVPSHPFWAPVLADSPVRVIGDACLMASGSGDVPATEPVILCLANIARWKGLHLLISAFSKTLIERPDARLIIAGSTHEQGYLEELQLQIESLGLEEAVSILPFAADIATLYRRASATVSSSISVFGGPETFGRTVIESWSFGKPVIAFSTGGPKYLIRDGIDGLLVPEGDCDALAKAMSRVLGDPNFAAALGRAGYVRSSGEFSAESIGTQLLSLLKTMDQASTGDNVSTVAVIQGEPA